MVCQTVAVLNHGSDSAAVGQGIRGEMQFPVPLFQPCHGKRGLIPVIEVSHQVERIRCRRPFPVNPAIRSPMEAIIPPGVCEVTQAAFRKHRAGSLIVVHAKFNIFLIRLQRLIILNNSVHGFLLLHFLFTHSGGFRPPASARDRDRGTAWRNLSRKHRHTYPGSPSHPTCRGR